MLFNLMPWIIMAISLGGILTIVLLKIPVLLKLPAKPPEIGGAPSLRERVKIRLRGLKYSSYQPRLVDWFEKTLRKLRVLILKIDNLFIKLIGKAREKSQVWTVRSRAWMEQHQLKKIEKLRILEKLDQAEVLESIKKAKEQTKDEAEQNLMGKSPQTSADISEEKIYIDLIAKDPRNVDAYRKLGFLYLEQGNKEDAKQCFRQVLKINPNDFEVIRKMKELG